MTRTQLLMIASLGLGLLACGSEVETERGTGGAGTGTAGGEPVTSPSSQGSGGAGGGEACEDRYDAACNCAACGGTCIQACNFSPEWSCYEPGPPVQGERSCGGFENCSEDEACIHVEPQGDGCVEYFCAPLPAACADDPTCTCVAPFIDQHDMSTECSEEGGLEVLFYGFAWDVPWDQPACGTSTCVDDESCFACHVDGSGPDGVPSYQCSALDPSAPGIQTCSTVWSADP